MDFAADFVKSWTKLTKDWAAQMESELAPQLTVGQLEVLELMKAHEPMKPSEILPYLETTPAAVTTLLDRMERNGLVERNRDERDRRIVWVTMTELGHAEVERGLAVRSDVVNRSLERISSHNRQLLVYLIAKVSGTHEAVAAAKPRPQEATAAAKSQPQEAATAEKPQPQEAAQGS